MRSSGSGLVSSVLSEALAHPRRTLLDAVALALCLAWLSALLVIAWAQP